MASDAIEYRCHHLRLLQAHGQHHLIDDQLVHRQVAARHAGNPPRQLHRASIQFSTGYCQVGQPPIGGLAAVDEVACEHHLLCTNGTKPERPHRSRGAPPHAGRHVADARVFRHDEQVAAQGNVAASRHRCPVDLGDRRLGAAPQAHEVFGDALHLRIVDHRVPRVLLLLTRLIAILFGIESEVVAAAEPLACAFDHDDVDFSIGIGPFHRSANFSGHLVIDGVEPFGAIEQEPGDPRVRRVLLNLQGGEAGHASTRLGWGGKLTLDLESSSHPSERAEPTTPCQPARPARRRPGRWRWRHNRPTSSPPIRWPPAWTGRWPG